MDFRRLLTVAIFATALMLVYYTNHSFTFTNEVLITTTTIHQALAQVPPIPTPPEIDDKTIAGIQPPTTDSSQSQVPQSATPPNTSVPPTPTIQITSHQDGSQVPVGDLTIQGSSSDNQESNCQVYADVNDIAPLQNATATGANGGDDYSQWTFTYTQDYQLITHGANELTAKISCFDAGVTTMPLSEWHSINVTGVVSSGTSTSTPTTTPAAPTPTLPATQIPTTDEGPGAELRGSFIPSPVTPPSLPFATSEQPSGDLSQGGGEGDDDDDDDDDDDGDDEGDDIGGDDDDDDGGEGDDG
jgi:hypothetical protein